MMTASQVVERFDPLENTLAGILPCLESVAINQFDFNGGHLQRPIRQRYALIQEMKTDYPIELLCDTLQVSRSGYCAWQSGARSRRSESDAALCTAMREAFAFSRQTCGYPRMSVELRSRGFRAGKARVARLMRACHLQGRQPSSNLENTEGRTGMRDKVAS